MTLKQLEYFMAIVETGNMTQAAKNLNISQPPLSLQLKALEDEFGVRLFDREKKSLVITPKGKLLYEKARQIVSLVNDTVSELQLDVDLWVTIRLGTISSVCSRLLPKLILEFRQSDPHVDFQIFEGSTTQILNQLDAGEIDLGIVREPFNTTLYHYLPVVDKALKDRQQDYFVAIGEEKFFEHCPGDDIPLAALKGQPLILHRRYMEILTNACRQQGFAPTVICQNNDFFSSLSWAAAGIGIAVLPYTSAISSNDPDMQIKVISKPKISSRAYVVWKKEGQLSPEAVRFTNMLEG